MVNNIRRGQLPSELGDLFDVLEDLQRRISTLEAPSGEALSSTVTKLQDLVADIQEQLDEWVAGRYTNAQIDTSIANGDAAVVAQINPAIDAKFAGSPTVGGSLTVNGNETVVGEFRAPNSYNFDITYTRRTAWIGNDGRLGYAASSRTKKGLIRDADEERLARLLDIVPKSFLYREEIRRRVNLRATYGIDYMPPREIGLIAEELDEAGLHEFVMYDEDGQPEGIEYSMLVVALLAVERRQQRDIDAMRAELDEIRKAIG